ncbi:dephospho-CoA kinase [Shewanella sp. 4t3-1-2LB]|uniref:dephospho-CoA kinase n=1 Tax=Shewanella sp. 4t3-1-2LB TaxID=2817682 RepID=UPI001A99259B|nr:dephospho-CoA kinase [Shewanella sp. 4t3-1-2LB]MBO1271654.1 dephospho-CoA kinase [Shewanella sp. 4t3-1-2LB]
MSDYIVGLTGGIGSGKTTVANLFAELGVAIIDADVIAREVVAPGSAGLQQIIEHFGTEMLNADGTLNRAKLRETVFSAAEERRWLNQLLHPMIRQRMLAQAQAATSPYAIMVVPLLFENGLECLVNHTLVIDIGKDTQIWRTIDRDHVSKTQVINIIDSQISREQRLAKADDVINNEGDVESLKSQILALHNNYLKQSEKAQ